MRSAARTRNATLGGITRGSSKGSASMTCGSSAITTERPCTISSTSLGLNNRVERWTNCRGSGNRSSGPERSIKPPSGTTRSTSSTDELGSWTDPEECQHEPLEKPKASWNSRVLDVPESHGSVTMNRLVTCWLAVLGTLCKGTSGQRAQVRGQCGRGQRGGGGRALPPRNPLANVKHSSSMDRDESRTRATCFCFTTLCPGSTLLPLVHQPRRRSCNQLTFCRSFSSPARTARPSSFRPSSHWRASNRPSRSRRDSRGRCHARYASPKRPSRGESCSRPATQWCWNPLPKATAWSCTSATSSYSGSEIQPWTRPRPRRLSPLRPWR